MHPWTFLSNHALILLCIARDPGIRLSELAREIGITERAAQRLVGDLLVAGYLSRAREGRRNVYQVYPDRPLRHPLERHRDAEALLAFVGVAAGSTTGEDGQFRNYLSRIA